MTIQELLDQLRRFPPDWVVFTACHDGRPDDCNGLAPADGVQECQVELSVDEHDSQRVTVDGVAIGRNESADYEYALAQKAKLLAWLALALSGAIVQATGL